MIDQTHLVPGAVMMRSVISKQAADVVGTRIAQGLADIAAASEISVDTLDRLCSAWNYQCAFVYEAVEQFKQPLTNALANSQAFNRDTYEICDASVFIGSHDQPSGTHAHQDIAYKWNRPEGRYALTTWLALDPCGPQSGALTFSDVFSKEIVGQRQDFLHPQFVNLATTSDWLTRQVIAVVDPGDLVVFDSTVWHATTNFAPPGRRCALAIRWRSTSRWEDTIHIPRPPLLPDQFGMDTSGILLCAALQSAFPLCPMSSSKGSVKLAVDWLLQEHPALEEVLGERAITCLHNLSLALRILENHGGRPSPDLWLGIRDRVIPALRVLENKGDFYAMA